MEYIENNKIKVIESDKVCQHCRGAMFVSHYKNSDS